jgi:hypothetical protein
VRGGKGAVEGGKEGRVQWKEGRVVHWERTHRVIFAMALKFSRSALAVSSK